MKISKQARREAKQLFRSCLVAGLLDQDRARQAVAALIAQKPRAYFAILSHLQRLVKLEVARRAATIESAVPLAPDLQSSLQASLGRLYGPGLTVSVAQDTALIAGLRVQVGSDVYNGSVQGRLAVLAESF